MNNIDLTFVDKIVMVVEIVITLEDLHSHEEYHGNLSDQCIFIDSCKDAYLDSHDQNKEQNNTIKKGSPEGLWYDPYIL